MGWTCQSFATNMTAGRPMVTSASTVARPTGVRPTQVPSGCRAKWACQSCSSGWNSGHLLPRHGVDARGLVRLAQATRGALQHEVFKGRRPTAAAGDDVVDVEHCGLPHLPKPAVAAPAGVALEDGLAQGPRDRRPAGDGVKASAPPCFREATRPPTEAGRSTSRTLSVGRRRAGHRPRKPTGRPQPVWFRPGLTGFRGSWRLSGLVVNDGKS